MANQNLKLKISCDVRPLKMVLDLFIFNPDLPILQSEFRKIPDEITRIETDFCAADTGELRVVFYPSDALLRFTAAIFTRQGDFSIFKRNNHIQPPS